MSYGSTKSKEDIYIYLLFEKEKSRKILIKKIKSQEKKERY